MAGLKVVPVKSLQDGSLDLADLKEKAEKHKDNLAVLMVRTGTDSSTYFRNLINDSRSLIHPLSASSKMVFSMCTVPIIITTVLSGIPCRHVKLSITTAVKSIWTVSPFKLEWKYLSYYPNVGANLNAQIGLTNPATCGGDVCHMNLHKTFAMCVKVLVIATL